MKHFNLTRSLPASVDSAFAWLTDYTPDDSCIFGDPPGGRTVERVSENQFHLANGYPGTSLREETHVMLCPPDSWHAEGNLRYGRLNIASYTQDWKLRPLPGGSELQMSLDVSIKSLAVRLFLRMRPGFIKRQVEAHYDRIADALARETGGR